MVDSDGWIPLEANPEVLDAFLRRLGASEEWSFADVYSLDEEMLATVPRPVAAVLMVYPITPKSEEGSLGTLASKSTDLGGGSLYFMEQTISNACGTVALVHAVANNLKRLGVPGDSPFANFVKSTRKSPPLERCKLLGSDKTLSEAHSELSVLGQSEVPSPTSDTNLHFVAFIHQNGKLYEMDGRKEAPVEHGASSEDTVLEDSVRVVKQFVERDPDLITFSILALAKV